MPTARPIRVVGLGAGGHAKVVIEILRSDERLELVGLLDNDPAMAGKIVSGVPVLGPDQMLVGIERQGVTHFFVGVGSTGDTSLRRRLHESAAALNLAPVTAVHPRAIVAGSARIGHGCQVMAGAIVNAEAVAGVNVCINTGAIVEHDCLVGNHAYIATGARLGGAVSINEGAFVGAGATIRQSITVGARAIVAAGAVVVANVPTGVTVVGVPARPVGGR
jgi:UDP-perosamine 4-acetyltransferase